MVHNTNGQRFRWRLTAGIATHRVNSGLMSPWLQYFKKPFPSAKGFSPYRFPGILVHLPVIGAFLVLGLLLLAATRRTFFCCYRFI